MVVSELQKALSALKEGGYSMGDQFEVAHEIAQAHEGEMLFDWLHALLHRIEGDSFNANYWYRRAGIEKRTETSEAEAAEIQAAIE